MFIYMSGTPRNDVHQIQENSICTHRLFSLHGSYQRAVMNWLRGTIENAAKGHLDFPKYIMLDSGAFTAWNAGEDTSLKEVMYSYNAFIKETEGLFDEIWMINLDKIPGERGRDPTVEELIEAVKISDENYEVLISEFGDKILPVFHQGEPDSRMFEVAEMTEYICLSPRNDIHENSRKLWSQERHMLLRDKMPDCRTHGLATTGNSMVSDVPWYSIDSAAWILHAGFGKVDMFEDNRYKNYFVSYEGGKAKTDTGHYDNQFPHRQKIIRETIESYDFTLEEAQKDSRIRSIICMGEIQRFVDFARQQHKERVVTTQQSLFGEI